MATGFILVFSMGLIFVAKFLSALQGIILFNRQVRQQVVSGSPNAVPGFDEAQLHTATWQLEELGFVLLQDQLVQTYSSREESPLAVPAPVRAPIADPNGQVDAPPATPAPVFVPQAFGRVMVHPVHGCFGKIIFSAVSDAKGKVLRKAHCTVVFVSLTGTAEDDWTYSNGNENYKGLAKGFVRLQRRPRWLGMKQIGVPPAAMLNAHLERRAAVAQGTGKNWKQNLDLADDDRMAELAFAHIRAVYAGLSPLPLAWKLIHLAMPRKGSEWLGELEGRLPTAG